MFREQTTACRSSVAFFWRSCCCAAAPQAFAAGPTLLFDPATEEVISQDRAGEPWYPASLTKLMTAYVIFQKIKAGQLTLEQKIPFRNSPIPSRPARSACRSERR